MAVLALPLLLLGAAAATPEVDAERAREALFGGVESLAAPGLPGDVVAFGPSAFVALVDQNGMPVVAGAEAGKGRVLILGHGGYLGRGALEQHDTARFMTNAVRWLSGGKRRPRVSTPGDATCAELFEELVIAADEDPDYDRADVVVMDLGGARTRAELERLRAFVEDGGGLLATCTGWGWQQLNPRLALARDLFGNRLLEPYGLCFGARTSAPRDGAFLVADGAPGHLAHAGAAFAELASGRLGAGGGGHTSRPAALERVRAALAALSDHEPLLILPLRRLLEGVEADPGGLRGELQAAHGQRQWRPLEERWGEWLVVGPFASSRADVTARAPLDGRQQRFAPDGAGADRRKAWKGRGGKHRWVTLEVDDDGRAFDVGAPRLDKALAVAAGEEGTDRSVAYLARRVELDAPIERALQIEASGGLELWIDGHSVLRREHPIPAGVERTDLVLRLEPGVHHLFLKLAHERGVWSFRIAETRGALEVGAIDAAVGAGVDYLARHQLLDGSWPGYEGYGPGLTAFALYALRKSGVARDDPVVRRAWTYVQAHRAEHTYSLGSVLLASFAHERGEPGEEVRAQVQRLIDMQESSGIWAYPIHPSGARLPEDLSTTLYAALALRAAHERGVAIPDEVWSGLIEGALTCWRGDTEDPRRGFTYRTRQNEPNARETGAMTGAGLSILWIARDGLGGRVGRSVAAEFEAALQGARGWLEDRLVFDENPGREDFHLFHVYGIERTGELLGLDQLGGVAWYATGARYLVQLQGEDGSWKAVDHSQAVRDTSLALLFLSRATRPSSARDRRVHAVLSDQPDQAAILSAVGRGPFDVWIAGYPDSTRDAHGRGSRREVRLQRARYLGTRAGSPGEVELAVVDAREGRDVERCEARLELPAAGAWTLWAELELAGPADGSVPGPVRVRSGSVEVLFEGELETTLDYAAQGRDNLLRGQALRFEASSQGGAAPDAAADGRQGSFWACTPGDSERRWAVELERGVDANLLLLSHANPHRADPGRARPFEVELWINGESHGSHAMDPDPRRKTAIELGRLRRVIGIELRLLPPPGSAGAALGLSEVELLAR